MSAVSGIFPNAITPTFSSSSDPALKEKQKIDNQTAVFAPVDEPQSNASSSNQTFDKELPRQVVDANEQALAEEQALIQELSARDKEVRDHEQAHQAVGGQYAGAMEFTYQRGPDGKRYTVGGEVSIDVSKVAGDPQATMNKANQVRRAALAPAEPSAQDRQVAALASQMYIEAQVELRELEQASANEAQEERSEQSAINQESADNTAQRARDDENGSEEERNEEMNEERLADILEATSNAISAALEAAYGKNTQQDVGFNLDTRV